MDDKIKQKLLDKNQKLISMIIERAKRDFPEDIAIIGLTGSFSTEDFHEKSDLDLVIINNTDRGWGIGASFILDDIGYDIYCTPWKTRIEVQANLESPMVSCLVDLQILYCAKPEYMDRFNAYRMKALEILAQPIGRECIERAKISIDHAKQAYANTLLMDDIGTVKYAASEVLYHVINGLTHLNNTYFKRGIKRYREQLATYTYLPEAFEELYMAVIKAKTIEEIRNTSYEMMKSIIELHDKMHKEFVIKPVPTYDNLGGTYEELWCNYRNKVIASVEANDQSYVYHVANGAQDYLDEMAETRGTEKFDLMQYFDAEHLCLFKKAFLHIMDAYLEEYKKVGRKVERYETYEQLYEKYMGK